MELPYTELDCDQIQPIPTKRGKKLISTVEDASRASVDDVKSSVQERVDAKCNLQRQDIVKPQKKKMGDIAKHFRKQTTRTKEKLLGTFGKADRTIDEHFEENHQNFLRQQVQADKISKSVREYVRCIKATCVAAKVLNESIRDVYEPNWPNKHDVQAMTQSLDLLWDDYQEKLTLETLNPLQTYCSQFNDIAKKIDKRGRKLLDYDSARHNLLSLTTGNGKKDDAKVTKAQENLATAQQLYVQMNEELLQDLPALFEHRLLFYSDHLQKQYNLSHSFHNETAKVSKQLVDVFSDLYSNNIKTSNAFRITSMANSTISDDGMFDSGASSPRPVSTQPPVSIANAERSSNQSSEHSRPSSSLTNERGKENLYPNVENFIMTVDARVGNKFDSQDDSVADSPTVVEKVEHVLNQASPPISSTNDSNQIVPEPKNLLFKVQATHAYIAQDSDELSFESGELIYVVSYDDPEEQDDGWQMGIKASNGDKGVFPQNFTKNV